MLKKIFFVGVFTGTAQIFSVIVLKFLSQKVGPEQLKSIGQVDTMIFLIMNILALGLQSVAIRNLALSEDWEPEYRETQKARLTLGLVLAAFSVLFFINTFYLFFLLAPLLALSGDYALYARGHPIFGAFIAFIRVFVPYLLLVWLVFFLPDWLGWIYGLGLAIIYFLSNFLISRYLRTAYLFYPNLKNLRLYFDSIHLGIVTLSLYFIGQGLVLIIPYFYSSVTTAVAFIGLKFYVIYKGLLRILHQAFVNQMIDDNISLKVDQLSILAGIVFFGSVAIFPETFISAFFGKQFLEERSFFILLALSGLIYSIFLSMGTKSMLLKKDKPYTLVSVTAAAFSIFVLIVSSFIWQKATNITLSICAGEIICAAGLIKIAGTGEGVKRRIVFLGQNSLVLLLPVLIRYAFKDSLMQYLLSFSIVAVVLLFLHRKIFV